MDEKIELRLEEYKNHLQIWHFNSNIASNRISNFLTTVTIIFTILSGIFFFAIENQKYLHSAYFLSIILSIFSIMINIFWYSFIMRTQSYNEYCKRKCEEIQGKIQTLVVEEDKILDTLNY